MMVLKYVRLWIEEVRDKFSDIPMMIQHVTDDQDMIRDSLESATGGGITEKQSYRGMRMRIAQERGDATDNQRIGMDVMSAYFTHARKREDTRLLETSRHQWLTV